MNLEDKLKMAHEYAIKQMETLSEFSPLYDLASVAWQYADEMEEQYNQRKEKGLPDALLTKDKDGNCTHFHTTLNRTECLDCGAVLIPSNSMPLDWQPDWSVAPDWAKYWFKDEDGVCWWSKLKPYFLNQSVSKIVVNNTNNIAQSFNHTGNWKQSLRKRP